ncbi:MAG TPA: cytochrome c oxidase subunit 3 [Kofleriaceae bacterium]|nr:cytochrome c oxidase subunit 3 [Kofleriaceae bacterium]
MTSLAQVRRFRVAVWTVIASEALLFSGLFGLYWSYRDEYPRAFDAGVRIDIAWMGGVNTFVLLTSSFAIAWAVHAMRHARTRVVARCLVAVLLLGGVFLALKIAEWTVHISEGVVPGGAYYTGPWNGRGSSLFFTLYYFMTGLHALHVIAGMVLIAWVALRVRARTLTGDDPHALELVALYWHFVDAIWVFLWPMFYLMRA